MRHPGRWLLVAGVMAFSAATASAWYVVGGGACQAVVASPGAAPFNAIWAINPNPAGPPFPGGYGDVLLGVEEGRDYTSHFATLAAWIAPANPMNGFFQQQMPPANGFYGPPPAGYIQVQVLFRAVDDPLNPGWAALPGGAGQTGEDIAACHWVAEQMTQFRASAAAGIGGAGAAWPWMNIEMDLNPLNATYFEFYKFRTVH